MQVVISEQKWVPLQYEKKVPVEETYVFHCVLTWISKKKRGQALTFFGN